MSRSRKRAKGTQGAAAGTGEEARAIETLIRQIKDPRPPRRRSSSGPGRSRSASSAACTAAARGRCTRPSGGWPRSGAGRSSRTCASRRVCPRSVRSTSTSTRRWALPSAYSLYPWTIARRDTGFLSCSKQGRGGSLQLGGSRSEALERAGFGPLLAPLSPRCAEPGSGRLPGYLLLYGHPR